MEEIILKYDKDENICLLNYFNNIIIKDDTKGIFKFDNMSLTVKWDNIEKEDIFDLYDNNESILKSYRHTINIIHPEWTDKCIIKDDCIYRLSDKDEYGYHIFDKNILIIDWIKWDKETFLKINNIYYKEIYLVHPDWEGVCLIDSSIIYRKYSEDEKGKYIISDNKIIVSWEKWDEETFNMIDSKFYFYKNNINNKYEE